MRTRLWVVAGVLIAGILTCGLVVGAIGVPHVLIVGVEDASGASPVAGDVTFEAWLTTDPSSVLTESSFGCSYMAGVGCYIECGNFAASWVAGDVVHVDVIQISTGDVGSGEFVLTNDNMQMFMGMDGIILSPPPPPPPVVPPLVIVPAGETDGGGFVDRGLVLEEGEEPPMIGSQPLTAVFEMGEAVTGACNIYDLEGRIVHGSYIHVYIYSVNLDVQPESLTLIEHWCAHYDYTAGAYSYGWDTAGQTPGYYDVYLGFPDGSSQTARIQIAELLE